MNLKRAVAPFSFAFLSTVGCTSSSQRGPAASAPNDSSGDPTEPVSNVDQTQAPPDETPADAHPFAANPPGPAGAAARPIVVPRPMGPYRVRIVDAAMHDLRLFHREGRSYVLGTVGERYSVEISNPTARRVEAVISIDGIDAIDGTSADYAHKRGYILPAYGSATIDGFRTSLERVATFRFSSVADSYAGRQGQPRDVGVIGVAFFPEQPPFVATPMPVRPYDERFDDRDGRRSAAGGAEASSARPSAPAPSKAAAPPASTDVGSLAEEPSNGAALRRDRAEREGLGTEFGEGRDSHVEETEFVRANGSLPSDIVTFRYNDRAGLTALGFRVDPPVVADVELRTRETADPFRANRFAAPPP
jgi:hypothetical protein